MKIGHKSLGDIAFHEHFYNRMMYEHLVLIDELRDQSAKQDAHYKKQVVRYYNSKVKPSTIKKGDLVLRKNEVSRVDPNRKLYRTWEGPYRVLKANGNESYKLQDFEGNILARTWNDLSLRKFYP